MTKDDDIVRLLLAMATGTDYQERKHDIILKAAAAAITRLRAQPDRAAVVEAETLRNAVRKLCDEFEGATYDMNDGSQSKDRKSLIAECRSLIEGDEHV